MAASNITGQIPEQDCNVNITSSQHNDNSFSKSVSIMPDQASSSQNLLGLLSGQSVDQQNSVTIVNQATPTFVPLSQVCENEKRMYQQKLALILHAYKCQKKVHTKDEVSRACNKVQCRGMRQILHHIQVCNADTCTVPHCQSSKALVLHWKNCTVKSCELCSPFKKTNAHKQTALVCQENQSNQFQNQPVVGTTNLSDNNNYVIDFRLQNKEIKNQQAIQKPLDDQVPVQQVVHNFKVDNPLSSAKLISGATENCAGSIVKEWHRSIGNDFRCTIVDRIIKEILSTLNKEDLNDPNDPSFINVVKYARKSEVKLYQAANSIDEYYQLVAEKLYQIMRKKGQTPGSTNSATSSSSKIQNPKTNLGPAELNS